MDLATRVVRRHTHETVSVQSARWSRDGRTVVATRSGDAQHGDLLVIDVQTSAQRVIRPPTADGILWAVDFLPDGDLLAQATNAQGFIQLCRVHVADGTSTFVGPSDWDVEQAEVSASGAVVFNRNVHGESEVLYLSTADAPTPRVLARGGVTGRFGIDGAARTVVMTHQDTNQPNELLVAYTDAPAPVPAPTVLLPPRLAGVDVAALAHGVRREYHTFDGRTLDTFVWTPPVARLGAPPPAVVYVHGGPNDQIRGVFSPTVLALAEAGFVVLAPNFRGSTGYGRAFEDLNNHDWGGGDLRDIVSLVDAMASRHEIDRARVGIVGGSYGGYMVLRAITATPNVWAAGVDMYGMPDLAEDFRLMVSRFGVWYLTEMGSPDENPALYRERSPIHFLDRVRAPLLVFQGANDTNVPRAESDAVVAALRARRQPVMYVVYPDEGHGFTHREHRVDAITRMIAFFTRAMGTR
jgi:dipeptidyl aminopeptidase/acylaminoacyl peptidase